MLKIMLLTMVKKELNMSMTDNQKKCMDAMNDPEMLKFFEYAINNQDKMRELTAELKILKPINNEIGKTRRDILGCHISGEIADYGFAMINHNQDIVLFISTETAHRLHQELNELWPYEGM